jgi:hypothetical protein
MEKDSVILPYRNYIFKQPFVEFQTSRIAVQYGILPCIILHCASSVELNPSPSAMSQSKEKITLPPSYKIRSFISVFKEVRLRILSWVRKIKSISSHNIKVSFIIVLSYTRPPVGLYLVVSSLQDFRTECQCILRLPVHAERPVHYILYLITVIVLPRVWMWLKTVSGLVIGLIEPLQNLTTSNCSVIANSHTLQFTTTPTICFQCIVSSPVVAW